MSTLAFLPHLLFSICCLVTHSQGVLNEISSCIMTVIEVQCTFLFRFEHQDPVVADYHYNVYARSKPSDKLCDDSCRKQTLCSVIHILSDDYVKCLALSSEHL